MNGGVPAGYRPQSEDATYEVERFQFERWSALAPSEKAAIGSRASRALHRLCVAGLAHHYPAASARELELRALARKYGRDVVRRHLGIDVPEEDVRIG